MTNRYLYITLLAILGLNPEMMQAQQTGARNAPRLVVSITIDQLRTDYLETFAPLYCEGGFRRLLSEGLVYANASYPFSPVDRASAIAALQTGTTPYYNNIVGVQWMNRETLRPVGCVDDNRSPGMLTNKTASPVALATSTIGDELKVHTDGRAIVYAIAPTRDAAVLSAGHAADMALWIDEENENWCSSQYYMKSVPAWLKNYNRQRAAQLKAVTHPNSDVTAMAQLCINSMGMGVDDDTDLLCLTYDATPSSDTGVTNWQETMQDTYVRLDADLSLLIAHVESQVGRQNVLFVLTSTGYSTPQPVNYEAYRIPTGTFYMNRTANLLNMYLGAIWGQGQYVETTFHNQVFLNHKLLDTRKINLSDALTRSQELVAMMDGVRNVYTSLQLLTSPNTAIERLRQAFHPKHCGDLLIEVTPGWRITNEDTGQTEIPTAGHTTFPIIFYGADVAADRVTTPVSIDCVAPTVCRAIRIRAPNACQSEPLY